MEGDAIYFGRRAREERVAALKSANANARRSHLDMANRYDELVSAIESHRMAPAVSISH